MSISLRFRSTVDLISADAEETTARTLSFWDQTALWASLGCGLVILAPGAFLLPANSLGGAAIAAGLGAVLGGGLMAMAASSGARDRLDLAGFFNAALGPRVGRPLSTVLLLRNLVLMAFLLALMADAAAYLVGAPGSSAARASAAIGFGLLGLGFAALGPHLLLPLLVKRLLAPASLAIVAIVALSSYFEMGIPELLTRQPIGGWPNVFQGADLVALGALIWLPAVGAISRFARAPGTSGASAFVGFAPPLFVLALVGAVYVPVVAASESWELLTAVPLAAMALVMLLALEADGVVVLSYASGTEAAERSRRLLFMAFAALVAVAVAANFTAGDLEYVAFASALLFLPPVVLQWLCGRQAAAGSKVSYLAFAGAWVAGFVAAAWFYPGLVGPLREGVESMVGLVGLPFPLTEKLPWFGAVLPGVLVTAVAYPILSRITRGKAGA
jgi:hypothetical protein